MFRDDDDANDDPDYQQPASVSQKDDDMEDEDDKVTVHIGIMYSYFTVSDSNFGSFWNVMIYPYLLWDCGYSFDTNGGQYWGDGSPNLEIAITHVQHVL